MTSLQELIEQKAAIEKRILDVQRQERGDAIAKIRSIMAEHGLTASDLSLRQGSAQREGGTRKVAAKYRNPATGDTWSGRGLQPKWLKSALASGKTLADFAV